MILWVLLPCFSGAVNPAKDWWDVKSCLVLSTQLKRIVDTVDENPVVYQENNSFVDDWELPLATSNIYFVDYNQLNNEITVIQGPQEASSNSLNFNNVKKIGRIRLSKDFKNVQTRFFNDETLMIFALHKDENNRDETIVLFYDVKDNKLVPKYYFTHTWVMKKLYFQGSKMYVIMRYDLTKETVQDFIKKDWNSKWILPVFSEWYKYWLEKTTQKTAECKNFKYLFKPSKNLPQVRGVAVFNLNNVKATKELFYLIGNISQIAFSEKNMYVTVPWDDGTTIFQKFWLDPRLNYKDAENQSRVISWNALDNGILVDGQESILATVEESWKIKRYSITPFSSSFEKWETLELYTWEESYNTIEKFTSSLVLWNKDEAVALAEYSSDGLVPHKALALPLENTTYYLINKNPLLLFSVEQQEDKVVFSLVEKDIPQWEFRKLYTLAYKWKSHLLSAPLWNINKQNLLLPIEIQRENTSFYGIKVLQIPSRGKMSEIMARSYPNDLRILAWTQLKNFSYIIAENLIDLFIPNNSTAMSVLSRN